MAFAAAQEAALTLSSGKIVMVDKKIEKRGWFEFGTGKQTHVANGFHLPIVAAVRSSLSHPKGFTAIPPGEYVKFVPDHTHSMTTYITITSVDEDGTQHNICNDLQKRADYSVMVDKKGFIVDTKYGQIWQREY